MARKLTTEEFIVKAKEVHGEKYDYKKVNYVNNHTKIIITCTEHGDFKQIPNSHLQGRGCQKCNGGVKYTLNDFLNKAKRVHGDRYDYSKAEYINNHTKITLICTKHSVKFEQISSEHLQGKITCPQCLLEIKGQCKNGYWTYERCYETANKYEWLSDFTKQEGSCFNASRKNNWLKDFTWLKRHYDHEENIKTTKKHCAYKYDFPQFNSVYIGLTINLDRRYSEHSKEGSVYNFCKENNLDIPKPQIIDDNLTLTKAKDRERYWIQYYKDLGYTLLNKTNGGDSIGMLYKVKTGKETDLFIEKARRVHGNKYDYSKVVYINNKSKVIILCPLHGEFLQIPNNHLRGQICPKCSRRKKNNLVC